MLVIYTRGMRTLSPIQRWLIYPLGLRTSLPQRSLLLDLEDRLKRSERNYKPGKDMQNTSSRDPAFSRFLQFFEFLRNL
jgi:hypothetical protein